MDRNLVPRKVYAIAKLTADKPWQSWSEAIVRLDQPAWARRAPALTQPRSTLLALEIVEGYESLDLNVSIDKAQFLLYRDFDWREYNRVKARRDDLIRRYPNYAIGSTYSRIIKEVADEIAELDSVLDKLRPQLEIIERSGNEKHFQDYLDGQLDTDIGLSEVQAIIHYPNYLNIIYVVFAISR